MPKPILISQNCEAESAGTISDWLDKKGRSYIVVHTYRDDALPGIDEVGAIINLGCPHPAYRYFEHDYLKKLYALVAQAVRNDVPYLGICFGAQMLAHMLGAKVMPNKVREIGTYQVSLTKAGLNDSIFAGIDTGFDVFHWHNDTFSIPAGAELLAEGVDCKNQAFRKGNAIGLQFHLEPTVADVSLWCKTYHREATEAGKTQDEIVTEFEAVSADTRRNNFKLLENFFGLR